MQINKIRNFAILLIFIFSITFSVRALAFDAPPWDTGHETERVDNGDTDTDPGPQCTNPCASPFEVSTGNFIYSTQDIFIPALGPDINIVRTYNSRDMRSGPFGEGWVLSYDQRVVETTNETQTFALYQQGNGKRERFVGNGDGDFTPPSNISATLTKLPQGTWNLIGKDGLKRNFNFRGQLASLVDRNGNTLTITYDGVGLLLSLSDAAGRTLTFTRGPHGKIDNITGPAGRVFKYGYDGQGNLTEFIDPLGNKTQYVYDIKHNLIQIIDPRGNTVLRVTYDNFGRVASYTEQGELWTVNYFPDQKKTTKRDSKGNVWTLFYDQNGNITEEIDPLGSHQKYTYDSNFNITSIEDKNGKKTSFAFDSKNNLISMTDALQKVSRFTYEPKFNQLASSTDPLGNRTTLEYDSKGNLTKITDALGHSTTMSYDSKGQLILITDALGRQAHFEYDRNGNLTKTIDPLNNTTLATFDLLGNIISKTDAEGRTTKFLYDKNNRLTEVTDASGSITQYNYDKNGNLVSLEDAKNHITSFEYDFFNRLTKVTNALGQSKSFTYDGKGNLLTRTDAKGQITKYTYDALNRLISKETPDNKTTSTYDREGNLTSLVDNDSSLNHVYDVLNRIIEVKTGATAAQPATSIKYSYDAAGNRTNMTDPQGGVTGYTYDNLNRLTALTNPRGETTTYVYDVLSRRTNLTRSNASITNFSYNAASWLTTLEDQSSGITVSRFEYTYNKVGNRISTGELGGFNNYTYDAVGQLTSATHPQVSNPQEHFTYDRVGNRLASHISQNYSYDSTNRLLLDDQFSYMYDANGNLTQKTDRTTGLTTRYAYDAENKLIRIDFPDGSYAAYRYDGIDRRIEKNLSGQITRYIYDNEDILLELDGTNATVARYTHGPGFDEPISIERGGSSTFYHVDGLGSIVGLTDINRNIVQSYLYDSFGKIANQTGTLKSPYAFTSREYDAESGLYYFRARMYDPTSGRFLQQDPIRFASGDINLYRYVFNNPVNFIDPSGLIVWDLLDVGFFLWSLKNFSDCPGLGTGLDLALDTVSLLPIIPSLGIITKADDVLDAAKAAKYGTTPKGRPLTKHYATETGPLRNIPGSVVDHTIDTTKGVPVNGGKTVHYDPENNVTVVTGDGQSIVSVHKGPPRKGQY